MEDTTSRIVEDVLHQARNQDLCEAKTMNSLSEMELVVPQHMIQDANGPTLITPPKTPGTVTPRKIHGSTTPLDYFTKAPNQTTRVSAGHRTGRLESPFELESRSLPVRGSLPLKNSPFSYEPPFVGALPTESGVTITGAISTKSALTTAGTTISVPRANKRKASDEEERLVKKAKPRSTRKATSTPSDQDIVTDRPAPIGQPTVWSNTKINMTETTPYFAAAEGSWYTHELIVKGHFLSKNTVPRMPFDLNVVISRSAGGTDDNGEFSRDHDPSEKTIRSIENTYREGSSIVLIMDNKAQAIRCKLPKNFQVLDQFHITYVWWECYNGFKICKVKLERIDVSSLPWYAPEGTIFEPLHPTNKICAQQQCSQCGQESKQVYQVWMCLNRECNNFWCHSDGSAPVESHLVFNQDFLSERAPFRGNGFAHDIIMQPPKQPTSTEEMLEVYNRDSWKGFWCNKCGACNSRKWWSRWECLACQHGIPVHNKVLTVPEANTRFDKGVPKPVDSSKLDRRVHEAVKKTTYQLGPYEVDRFEVLPGNDVWHFKANKMTNAAPGGPDNMFKELQECKGLDGLKRHSIGAKDPLNPIAKMTRHFAQNWGLPYKFILDVDSTAFSDAPEVVLKGLRMLQWAGKVIKMKAKFNEILIAGYMAKGAMNKHTDGEDGLGPTIGTLSLGCDAKMAFEMDKKYHVLPLNKKNEYVPETFIGPDVEAFEDRLAMRKWLETNPLKTTQEQTNHFLKLPGVIKARKGSHSDPKDFLRLILKHGDIVIMNGPELQKLIKHGVEVLGCLRSAITARHISTDNMTPEAIAKGEFDESLFPEFNGPTDLVEIKTKKGSSTPLKAVKRRRKTAS